MDDFEVRHAVAVHGGLCELLVKTFPLPVIRLLVLDKEGTFIVDQVVVRGLQLPDVDSVDEHPQIIDEPLHVADYHVIAVAPAPDLCGALHVVLEPVRDLRIHHGPLVLRPPVFRGVTEVARGTELIH